MTTYPIELIALPLVKPSEVSSAAVYKACDLEPPQKPLNGVLVVLEEVPDPTLEVPTITPPDATKVVISSAQTVVAAGVTVILDGEALTVTVTVTLVVIVPSTAVTV